MPRFEHPLFLHLLWAVPVLLLLWSQYGWWRRRAMTNLAEPAAAQRLLPGWSGRRFWLKNGLLLAGLALLAIAWANPQQGTKKQTTTQKSADVFIALDISQSMLAEDIAPSRLERAKSFVRKVIHALEGDRIGLIFFAGDAFLQMPLSTDYAAADMFVASASPDMVSVQGTAIPAALSLAMKGFDPEPGGGRAVILVSDGENHDEDAVSRARSAHEDGIVVLAVGAGTTTGAPIPLGSSMGNTVYKRDENNEVVRTRMDETLMQNLAIAGGGVYFKIDQGNAAVSAIQREIGRLQKREREVRSFAEFDSYFQWFLLPAFLLLALESWLVWRSRSVV